VGEWLLGCEGGTVVVVAAGCKCGGRGWVWVWVWVWAEGWDTSLGWCACAPCITSAVQEAEDDVRGAHTLFRIPAFPTN